MPAVSISDSSKEEKYLFLEKAGRSSRFITSAAFGGTITRFEVDSEMGRSAEWEIGTSTVPSPQWYEGTGFIR